MILSNILQLILVNYPGPDDNSGYYQYYYININININNNNNNDSMSPGGAGGHMTAQTWDDLTISHHVKS